MEYDSGEDKVIPLRGVEIVFTVLLKVIIILFALGFTVGLVNSVYHLLGGEGFWTWIVAIPVSGLLITLFMKMAVKW